MEQKLCLTTEARKEIANTVAARMPDDDTIDAVAELFKMFGDPTRAKMLCALQMQELCVCDLSRLLSMQQSAVSHQLRLLKTGRLVRSRKQGREVYYSLDDDHIRAIFAIAFTHISEEGRA